MNKKINILATLVLIIGLTVPTGMQAGFVDNMLNWGGTTFGATVGHRVGAAVGDGVAYHGGEMIPNNLKKPLLVIGIVGVVAYIIYAHREDRAEKNNRRAKSCSKKGCSHKSCK